MQHPMKSMPIDDVIVAHCTPRGSGALAMIRLSGREALNIADRMSKLTRSSVSDVQTHTIHCGWIIDSHGEKIDQVMMSVMHAPRTFTGEHTVEITCHNNQFLIIAIIKLAILYGARHAQRGEYAQRAFLHGKIDLVQSEALNDLIHAQTQHTLKKSL